MSMHTLVDSLTQLLQWQRTTEAWELLAAQDDPHAAFDQEINDVQAACTKLSENFVATLQRLRIGRNGLAPIHRLPNEVLQQIFRQSTGCGRDHRSNLAIASTCSRWRSAALGDSMLWSCIELKLKQDGRLTTLFLERSGERQLTVHLDNFPYTHKSLVGQLLARTRSLSTSVSPTELNLESAPFLEDLTLRYSDWQSAVYPKVFNLPLASLRELTLRNCCLSFKPGHYVGLRRLEITAALQHDLTHTDLLVIFRESPLLEDLSLVFTAGSRRDLVHRMPVVTPAQRIKMHSLRSLKLSMLAVEVVDILSAVDFSAAIQFVDIAIGQQDSAAERNKLETPVRLLFTPRCLPTSFAERLRSLSVCHFKSAEEQVWKLAGEGLYKDSTQRKCTLNITCGPTTYTSDTFLRALVADYPLASVASLTICTCGLLDYSKYALILAHCQATTHLSIHFIPGEKSHTFNLHSFCDSVTRAAALDGHLPPLANICFAVLKARDSPFVTSARANQWDALAPFQRSRAWLFNLGDPCADSVKAFFSQFSNTLKQVDFTSLPLDARRSNCTPSECMKAFVQAVRNVGFELRVTATDLVCPNFQDYGITCYPRAVWPAGEDFTWTCNMQASHGPPTQYCRGCGWEPPLVQLPSINLKELADLDEISKEEFMSAFAASLGRSMLRYV